VLLEALTGERTFPGPPMTAVMARLDGPPPIPDGLPAPWPGLLAAMTATDPAVRPSAGQVAAALCDAAPVGLLAAADNTVQLAALPVDAGLLDASQTQRLPAIVDEPEPVLPLAPAGTYRRGAGWLPWLLAALILASAAVVAYLIYHALQAGSGTPGPSSPATRHTSTAPTRTSKHSAATTATTASRPATTATSTSAPPTTSSAPPTSNTPSSASTPASSPATSAATSTGATSTAAAGSATAGTSAAPASQGGGSPSGSPSVTH